jgi:Heterokaryon incompatibility protein (HET)
MSKTTIMRLAMICRKNGKEHGQEHAGLWIDQLCIPQTDDEIKATLAKSRPYIEP